jgi:hypothetical protein
MHARARAPTEVASALHITLKQARNFASATLSGDPNEAGMRTDRS